MMVAVMVHALWLAVAVAAVAEVEALVEDEWSSIYHASS
jgi:hypothetical protein